MTVRCNIFDLSVHSSWKFYSAVCCIRVSCQETGVNAITYEMGLMWLGGPANGAAMRIHVALISVRSQTRLSGERGKKLSVSHLHRMSSQPEVFLIFIPRVAVYSDTESLRHGKKCIFQLRSDQKT